MSDNDARVLNRVKRRAYRLDYCLFNLCGIRFGWGSVIGLVPFFGDVLDAVLAMMVARECQRIDGGLPSYLHAKMVMNVIVDFLIGLVPFVGDLADAVFKANTRNAILLENYLREKAAKADRARTRSQRGQSHDRQVDLSLPEEFDRYQNDTLEP